jgi:hypothetical protein
MCMPTNSLLSHFIRVSVEGCYKEIPFGDEVIGSKPSEVITACDNYDRFTFNPFVEELGIPRCVVMVRYVRLSGITE